MSQEIDTAKRHLVAVSQGAQVLRRHIEDRDHDDEARDFLELIRHIHGAIENIAAAVEHLER